MRFIVLTMSWWNGKAYEDTLLYVNVKAITHFWKSTLPDCAEKCASCGDGECPRRKAGTFILLNGIASLTVQETPDELLQAIERAEKSAGLPRNKNAGAG